MADFLLRAISIVIMMSLTLSVVLWFRLLLRLAQGQLPLPLAERRRAPWDHVEVLITIGMMMLGGQLTLKSLQLTGLVQMDFESLSKLPTSEQAIVMLSGSLVQLVIAVGLIAWIASRSNAPRIDFGLSQPVTKLVRIGAIGAVMLIPPVTIIQALVTQLIEYKHDLLEMINDQPSPMYFIVAGITGVLVAPFAEEVFFRMLFQGWLESFFGKLKRKKDPSGSTLDAESPALALTNISDDLNPYRPVMTTQVEKAEQVDSMIPPWWPILLSAFLFALAHLGQGPAPFSLFFLSLGLGYLYRQTHSVIPCITVHFILNAMTLSIVILSGSGG